MIDACIDSKTNYLDITGEVDVIDYAWKNDQKAKEKEITLFPSTGFDVIPTDCIAKKLVYRLPHAKTLELGLINGGGISRGTLLTTFQMMGELGKIRKNGKIIDSPIGEYGIKLNVSELKFNGISIPWGDVCSAYHSTGIPNITVYLGLPKLLYHLRHILLPTLKLFSLQSFYKLIEKIVQTLVTGPSKKRREDSETIIWGRITNGENEIIEAYSFFEGYKLTAIGSADVLVRVLNNEVQPGTVTPSLAFGSDYMNRFIIRKVL